MAGNRISTEVEETMKKGFALAVLCMALGIATARAEEPGDVRGCYATYISGSGKFLFEPFLKVADKEAPAEDGSSEVWGFRVWNLEPPDREGKTHPVNIPDSQWIPLNTFKEVKAGTRTKNVRCPAGLWPTQ